MEAIQEIISRELGNRQTNTVASEQLSCSVRAQCVNRPDEHAEPNKVKYSPFVDFTKPVDICKICGKPLQKDVVLLGMLRRWPKACRCREEELERKRAYEEAIELQRRLDKFKRYSLMDESFKRSTFENWKFRDDNRSLYEFGKHYCDNWENVKRNNQGLLLYGTPGNGKTFTAFAIANELYRRAEAVLATSVSGILRIIIDSYERRGVIGETEILNTLSAASLLILDDLGVENKTYWAYEKLYSILDSRYRSAKPTIITTNLSTNDLRDNLSIVDIKQGKYDEKERIYSRIIEMCSLVEVKGESWRIQIGAAKKQSLFNDIGLTKR